MGKPVLKFTVFINSVISSAEAGYGLFVYDENDPLLLVRLILDLVIVQNSSAAGDSGGHMIVRRDKGGSNSLATMLSGAGSPILMNDDHILQFPFAGSMEAGGGPDPVTNIHIDTKTKRKIERGDELILARIANTVDYGYMVGVATMIFEIQ